MTPNLEDIADICLEQRLAIQIHESSPTRVGVLGCPEAREKEQFWYSASRREHIRPRDMSLAHLMNALRMLLRETVGWLYRYDIEELDQRVRSRPGGALLLEEWYHRANRHTPHWSRGHVPFDRDWWEQRRLRGLVEQKQEGP